MKKEIEETPSDFEAIPQEQMQNLSELAKETRETENAIAKLEEQLKAKSDRLRELTEKLIPDIMMELMIAEIKLTTGEKLIMKKYYSASIKPEFQESAFSWLRERGHDSLIKNKVEGSFGKGEDEKVKELMEKLAPLGFTCKTSVHPQTLKSFVKEMLESGQEIPADVFGIYVGNKITIK